MLGVVRNECEATKGHRTEVMADQEVCYFNLFTEHGKCIVALQPGLLHELLWRWWSMPLEPVHQWTQANARSPVGDMRCFSCSFGAEAMVDDEGVR